MRILLTGSTGFLGNAILRRFDEVKVVLNRRSMSYRYERDVIELIEDFTDVNKIPYLISEIKKHRITHIIHAAATTPWSENNLFSKDSEMAKVLCEICNELKLESLLFFSGWIVYNMDGPPPFTELQPIKPDTEYGISKLVTENYFKNKLNYTHFYNLRLSSIYGPGQRSPGLMRNICEQAFKEGIITINSESTKRDYLYIEDFLDYLKRLLNTDNKFIGDINIGSGKSYSVLEVANIVTKIIQTNFNLKVQVALSKQIEESNIKDNLMSVDKARRENIIKNNSTPLVNGLKEYIIWGKSERIF